MPHLRRTQRPSCERLRRGRRRRRRRLVVRHPPCMVAQLVAAAAAARASRTARPRRARCRRRRESRVAARWPSAGRSRRRQCATCRAQGREATEGNRLSRGTQQPAQARFRTVRRDARQRRCGHASTHVIVDNAVGLSNELRALPSCKMICERADAAAEAPAVSDAGARRRSDARQRRCGHASTHLIVDSAVGLSNELRALPSWKIICERADAAAEAPQVSDAGARRRSRRSCERIGAHRERVLKAWRPWRRSQQLSSRLVARRRAIRNRDAS
jgi:hypothetical protein